MARILIVDDERFNVGILSLVVTQLGHDPIEAYNGHQAINLVAKNPPNLILLDYMMPGIDGIETSRQIRTLPGGETIPIILITASQRHAIEEEAKDIGVIGFLRKPLDLLTIKGLIEKHCSTETTRAVVDM